MPIRRAPSFAQVSLACLAFAGIALAGTPATAQSCDGLAAKVIRVTGASIAGRSGTLAVFRATDAERMSLDCGRPRRMVVASRDREPKPDFFRLIGLAGQALTGATPAAVETLALNLHQASLLAGTPQQGRTGPAALRCEAGPREDRLADLVTVCILAQDRPGLSRKTRAG